MKPIKVEFHRHENFVCGRVVDMPEELRGQGLIIESAKYVITSQGYPSLESFVLFLQGENKSLDDSWFHFEYWSERDAKTAIVIYCDLIEKWNKEHKEILDDVEKAYLSAVIKPFKNRVKYIKKMTISDEECIVGYLYEHDLFQLPNFKSGTMYKGIETNRRYTLKELGLRD